MHLALVALSAGLVLQMKAPTRTPTSTAGVLWDVDGTLVESTELAFVATNEVLTSSGFPAVSVADYKIGCRYTTPERFNYHIGEPTGSPKGAALGDTFDQTCVPDPLHPLHALPWSATNSVTHCCSPHSYVARVSAETAGLFYGIDRLLRSLALAGHPQGALSNACGEYVRAVVSANMLDEKPGERIGLFGIVRGADEVPAAKPAPDGLLVCCETLGVDPACSVYVGDSPSDGKAARAAGMKSAGVLWGANGEEALRDHFDVICADVPELVRALRDLLA
jgi:phosphoglycolate phosphatase-like HAD superfamily hydrolase